MLANEAARWRRVDFWFRVADRRNRCAWASSREMAREGYIANTGCQPVSAGNLNFGWRISFLLANLVIFDENFRFAFFRGEGAFEFLLLTCIVITVWDLTFFFRLSNFNGCDIWCYLSRYRDLFMKTQVKAQKCSSLVGNAYFYFTDYQSPRDLLYWQSVMQISVINLYEFLYWHIRLDIAIVWT